MVGEKSINALEIAKVVEKAGASAITVHPRTKNLKVIVVKLIGILSNRSKIMFIFRLSVMVISKLAMMLRKC